MGKIKFIKEFLKNWKEVGSVIPSCRFLAGKMLGPIDFKKAGVIVEIGPGLGCFTNKILEMMDEDTKLIIFEINPDFCRELDKNKDSRLTIFNVSALDMAYHLKEIKADYVISGIPLSTLANDSRGLLFKAIKNILSEGGVYVQFQYSLGAYKKLKSVFKKVALKFTLFNAPPAFVYQCVKESSDSDS
ncbi:MAG: ribosomal RNA adenine dimethylase [Patescibacteria group bacterium]|nr:ribosomal RNA adenine dimethylase [Patescibacteria group bacterium]MDE1988369.1 ribosomal RNA adenine dimethylase [Patescibacteria group bacterium]MDE2218077.1 ribosomal RNA adenine dimethylase [Patescibacteria group bacterium]